MYNNMIGFRPLTGILCFNSARPKFQFLKVESFRPVTGSLFVNGTYGTSFCHKGGSGFPSPYGDFVFQPKAAASVNAYLQEQVSVPLRGFCFSTKVEVNTWTKICRMFPSPYGDFVFQQSLRKTLLFLA